MERTEEIAVGRRLLDCLDRRAPETAAAIYRHDVSDYTCPDQLARERRQFFREGPLCLGLGGRVAKPGDFVADDFSGVPILLVRGRDGRLGAFLNVCRHRGAKVAEGCGSARAFTCPYHAWSYGLDGRLLGRPAEGCFDGMARDGHGLTPLPVEEKHGLIWVCPTPGGGLDVDGALAGVERDLAPLKLEGWHHYGSRSARQRMNWKLVVDTFLEGYHINVLHRETIDPIFFSNIGLFDGYGPNLRMVIARRSIESLRAQPEADWQVIPHTAAVYILFPNTVFILQGDHIETWHVYPDGDSPDHSTMLISLYTPEPAVSDSARRHWDRNFDLLMDTVEKEDFPLAAHIQRNFYAGAQTHTTFGRNEPALHHYHRQIRQALGLAGV